MIIKTKIFEYFRKRNQLIRSERAKARYLCEDSNMQYIYNAEDVYALVRQEDISVRGTKCSCAHVDYFYIEDISENSAKATKLTGKGMGNVYDCKIEHKINEARDDDYLITLDTDNARYYGDSKDNMELRTHKPQITVSELNAMCQSINSSFKSSEQEDCLPYYPTPLQKKHFKFNADQITQRQISDRLNAKAKHEHKRRMLKATKNGYNPGEIVKEELC